MPNLSEDLAAFRGAGYVIAPAGFGKTHLIAQAVSHSDARQLVLTHTYAGVNALRRKMREQRVPGSLFHIDTIASWTLRLSLSYASTSGWTIERPANNQQWTNLYGACINLMDSAFIRRIIRASYAGLYVDEYQDCSTAQHSIVLKLCRDLPCRVLGDPLQGIFDFDGQDPVQWEHDVAAAFAPLGQLDTPHRWDRAGAPTLGTWLRRVRHQLEAGNAIDLYDGRPDTVGFRHVGQDEEIFRAQGNTCRHFECDPRDTVIAIHKGSQEYKAKCHVLAKNVGGRFSSIEEIEGKDLFSFIRKIERARTNAAKLKAVIAFAAKCMTGVSANLSAATKRGETARIRANTRNHELVRWANAFLDDPNSVNMSTFLNTLRNINGVESVRADLLGRTMGVLRKHMLHPELTVAEAAELYHGEFRYRGRPVSRRKLIGTTLLVKGLEFDHGIVLDALSLSKKELYVAMTRGAKSLTIVSSSPILNPQF